MRLSRRLEIFMKRRQWNIEVPCSLSKSCSLHIQSAETTLIERRNVHDQITKVLLLSNQTFNEHGF